MLNNLEVEYKMIVNKEQFNELFSHFTPRNSFTQTNTYFDTENFSLRERGFAMRIRAVDNRFLFTLKTPKNGAYEEHECFVEDNTLKALTCPEIEELFIRYKIAGQLLKIGECTTHRSVYETELAELCFDINEYNNVIDYEIEYEQIIDHDGKTEFNKILSLIHLQFIKNGPSKIARACSL